MGLSDLGSSAEAVCDDGVVSRVVVGSAHPANHRAHRRVLRHRPLVLPLLEPRGVVVGVDHLDDGRHGSGATRRPGVTCHHAKLVLRHLQPTHRESEKKQDVHISQGSVATSVRYGGLFKYAFVRVAL